MKSNSNRSYRWLLWSLAVIGTGLDQLTKYQVFRWLYSGPEQEGKHEVFPGAFELLVQFTKNREESSGALARLRILGGEYLPRVNQGALFGLGGGYQQLANGVFAAISILAAGAIVYWSTRRSTARDVSLCTSLGLILAGTLGNLFDRVVFGGVRDFLHFYWIEWPVFNVADCCLVCGASLLLAQAFLTRPGHSTSGGTAVSVSREMAEAN